MSKVHLLSESSIEWLKQQAKSLKKNKSISQSQALYEVAVQQGFKNWKDLFETYKYETKSSKKIKVIGYDRSLVEPFEKEAGELKWQMMASKGFDISNRGSDVISDLSGFLSGEKQDLSYHNFSSQCSDQAHQNISEKHGYKDWNQLINMNVKEFVEQEYTHEQKIGAMARSLNIAPKTIKNSIFVQIWNSEEVWDISIDEWISLGFYEDYSFVNWLEKNDPYFQEFPPDGKIFRIISIDTDSFKAANKKIESILKKLAKKKYFFFPIIHGFLWINGKIDPACLEIDPDYPNDLLPLAQLPEIAWKRGY